METKSVTISVKGRMVQVPSASFEGSTIVVLGKWLKMAKIQDEAWSPGETVKDPDAYLEKIKAENLHADIFTFSQKIPHLEPKYTYPMEWDNVAAIPTGDFTAWWEGLPKEARKNVRRAEKRGVVLRVVPFDDALMQGILEINNETPIRQGRPFWHYGKSLDMVKRDYTTLLDRSEFIGAFHDNQLIGFIKMIYMGEVAGILQILSMNKHYDKRPGNALIAKAVERCHAQGIKYLTYGKYIYGKKSHSPLTEFKRRNGFEQFQVPQYYVPLTNKGKLCIALGLHLGWKQMIPESVLNLAVKVRSKWYEKSLRSDAQPSAAE